MKVDVSFHTGAADSVGGTGGFLQDAADRGYRSLVSKEWPVNEGFDPASLDLDEVASYADKYQRRVIFQLEEGLALLDVQRGQATGMVAAASAEKARALLTSLDKLIPEETVEDDSVAVTFWAYNPNGPINVRRRLEAPAWDEISDNYSARTREDVETLLRGWLPGRGGQLLLWSGVPGTGKTTAIRALAREWRDWAEVHYVTDPDKFFGSESDYMLGVLLGESTTAMWRILLLEDAGELLAADARQQTGQGLSRFLNAVDGLIGQGLNLLVLVTTNEDLKKLNPAVARPGRCASQIEFAQLDATEATDWLAEHGADQAGERSTLAELYAVVEGLQGARIARPVGFRA